MITTAAEIFGMYTIETPEVLAVDSIISVLTCIIHSR